LGSLSIHGLTRRAEIPTSVCNVVCTVLNGCDRLDVIVVPKLTEVARP